MDELLTIELEPEVHEWLALLPGKQYRKVEEYAGLPARTPASPTGSLPVSASCS
ncbi:hypothetical protein [Streptomyces ficellus]|uniref:hypothetical protein n=1 Tax=Streptomyces ficellus TaxID=1977088 RepID=UPI003138334C